MVIGVNHRTAPVEVRERFWIPEDRRRDALLALARADAIEEVLLLSSSERTEFLLWTRDPSAASGSVLNFLTREYGLKLCEWKFFYRKIDEAALAHVLLVTAGLDSLTVHEHECAENLKEASGTALGAGTLGRFLDGVVQTALTLSAKLHAEATRVGMDEAEKSAMREAKASYSKLLAERVVPTIVALRRRLDEICLQELESFYGGLSSLTSEEREKIEAFATRLTQRIAGTLAHELKEPCEKMEQERLTSAVQRLFHLEMLQRAMARAEN
jgi:glutamyl-tRNA reductase